MIESAISRHPNSRCAALPTCRRLDQRGSPQEDSTVATHNDRLIRHGWDVRTPGSTRAQHYGYLGDARGRHACLGGREGGVEGGSPGSTRAQHYGLLGYARGRHARLAGGRGEWRGGGVPPAVNEPSTTATWGMPASGMRA